MDALFSKHGTHTVTAVTAVVVPACAARTEVEVASAARAARTLRRRPIVAVRAGFVEVAAQAIARSGQEDAVVINIASEPLTVHAVERRPYNSAVVK